MKLQNDFLVDAPLDKTWDTLLDIERVATCLPGATLESDGADGVYRGSMSMRLGPMTLSYKGTARMAEVEEDEHAATIEVQAKELKGQGTASARIRNRLEPGANGATHVVVETDLNITGRPAQFGRGIMEDVAGKMLGDFAKRLEGEVLTGRANGHGPAAPAPAAPAAPAQERPAGAAPPPPPPPPPPSDDGEALNLGAAIYAPVAKRAAIGVGVVAILVVVLRALLGSRRRGLSVSVDWR